MVLLDNCSEWGNSVTSKIVHPNTLDIPLQHHISALNSVWRSTLASARGKKTPSQHVVLVLVGLVVHK